MDILVACKQEELQIYPPLSVDHSLSITTNELLITDSSHWSQYLDVGTAGNWFLCS